MFFAVLEHELEDAKALNPSSQTADISADYSEIEVTPRLNTAADCTQYLLRIHNSYVCHPSLFYVKHVSMQETQVCKPCLLDSGCFPNPNFDGFHDILSMSQSQLLA